MGTWMQNISVIIFCFKKWKKWHCIDMKKSVAFFILKAGNFYYHLLRSFWHVSSLGVVGVHHFSLFFYQCVFIKMFPRLAVLCFQLTTSGERTDATHRSHTFLSSILFMCLLKSLHRIHFTISISMLIYRTSKSSFKYKFYSKQGLL